MAMTPTVIEEIVAIPMLESRTDLKIKKICILIVNFLGRVAKRFIQSMIK